MEARQKGACGNPPPPRAGRELPCREPVNLNIQKAYRHATAGAAETRQLISNPAIPATAEPVSFPQPSGMDTFSHVAVSLEEEAYSGTIYTKTGTADDAGDKTLPSRYYPQLSQPRIGYRGTMVSYAELLEEAVSDGAIQLDENESVWSNFERAEKALIWDKAKPLFPWSSTLYTEDGQYVCRVEKGQITGARLAHYTDSNGRTITTQYLAEQLASGKLPIELDGDWEFLWSTDPDLYFKALDIGTARRQITDALDQVEQGTLTSRQFEDDMDPYLLLLFGRDWRKLPLLQLKEIIMDEAFGSRILQSLGTTSYPLSGDTE